MLNPFQLLLEHIAEIFHLLLRKEATVSANASPVTCMADIFKCNIRMCFKFLRFYCNVMQAMLKQI